MDFVSLLLGKVSKSGLCDSVAEPFLLFRTESQNYHRTTACLRLEGLLKIICFQPQTEGPKVLYSPLGNLIRW